MLVVEGLAAKGLDAHRGRTLIATLRPNSNEFPQIRPGICLTHGFFSIIEPASQESGQWILGNSRAVRGHAPYFPLAVPASSR
jgi:hypothetical protein